MALTSEVSVLRQRLDTVERLLEAKGILSLLEIENYQPNDEVAEEREHWRAEYIARVLWVLQENLDALNRG